MRRCLCAILTSILLLCGITACGIGKPSVRKEEQLMEDLVNAVPMLQTDINVSSLNIIKRQTNENEMSDTVYVEIEGTGTYYECVLSYVMYYSLYDQGWLLDYAERWYDGNWYGHPTDGVPEDTIRENLVPSSSRYNEREYWTSRLIEITQQYVDTEAENSMVFYKYTIENATDSKYGYYLVNDSALYEFDNSALCYYLLSSDLSDHTDAQFILSDAIIGETFSDQEWLLTTSNVRGKFTVTIDSINENYITGHGNYSDNAFSFEGTIETQKRKTSAGYDYRAIVELGEVNVNGSIIDIWFFLDPRQGIDGIHGTLVQ